MKEIICDEEEEEEEEDEEGAPPISHALSSNVGAFVGTFCLCEPVIESDPADVRVCGLGGGEMDLKMVMRNA